MTSPRISIVTPSFNQGQFLEECIDSVLCQNYPYLEYIVMDGGSTDNSVEIIKKYEKHLTYWQSKPDGGQYSAINEGFKKTTGEIMAWLNSDDKYHASALKIVGGVFNQFKDVDWITGRPTAWDEDGLLLYVSSILPHWTLEKCLNHQTDAAFIQQESTFWRRSLWEKSGVVLSAKLQFAADFELWIRFFRYANLYTVDALLGGFRFHPAQKTANFKNEYNKDVYTVICAEREANVGFFSEQDKSAQLTLSRQTLLDLKIIDCCNIPIATSIAPVNIDLQKAAIRSWQNLGFKVISINCAEEIALLRDDFTGVLFVEASRNAYAEIGRPLIYLGDILSALQQTVCQVCGILNSDIFLSADSDFVNFIAETVGAGLLFGSRIDIDSMENLDGEKFIYGFDFFFFNKAVLKALPESGFCIGVPWWDYWVPFVPLIRGIPCKELISPVAFHVNHETKWTGELFFDYGKKFADKVSQFGQAKEFTTKIAADSSPEQLTLFSFDILEYILKKSDKVVYPRSEGGAMRIEVGRKQYLAMRAQVIAHRRLFWVLNEQIKVARDCQLRLEALHASLSWRITKPLRWILDAVGKMREL
jgi:glycosyltransferase involved in cell wall biosynthesis